MAGAGGESGGCRVGGPSTRPDARAWTWQEGEGQLVCSGPSRRLGSTAAGRPGLLDPPRSELHLQGRPCGLLGLVQTQHIGPLSQTSRVLRLGQQSMKPSVGPYEHGAVWPRRLPRRPLLRGEAGRTRGRERPGHTARFPCETAAKETQTP